MDLITVEQIDELPIEDLRLDFASLMGSIVTTYGDDQEETTEEGDTDVTS
jgi:hypothetical protein